METQSIKLWKITNWLIVLSILFLILIYFKSLIEPLILSLFIWYLISAFKKNIGRISFKGRFMPKWLQSITAFLITFSVLWGIWEMLVLNVELIIEKSAEYNQNIQGMVSAIGQIPYIENIPGVEDIDNFIMQNLSGIDIKNYIAVVINGFSSVVGNLALIIIYVIFLLIEETFMPQKFEKLFRSKNGKSKILGIYQEITKSINTYFTVKTSMSLLTAVISYIILILFKVDFAILWSFLIFLFNYIPYVGSLIATLLPALFSIFQFASFWPFLWIFIAIETVQLFVGNYIEPKIMGKTLNLSPLFVIVSLSFWASIWGIVGMILSVPIVSVIVIILSYFPASRNIAIIFSEKGQIVNGSNVENE